MSFQSPHFTSRATSVTSAMALQRLATLVLLYNTAEPTQAIEWPCFIRWIGLRKNRPGNSPYKKREIRWAWFKTFSPIHCSRVGAFFYLSFQWGVRSLFFPSKWDLRLYLLTEKDQQTDISKDSQKILFSVVVGSFLFADGSNGPLSHVRLDPSRFQDDGKLMIGNLDMNKRWKIQHWMIHTMRLEPLDLYHLYY